MIVLFASYLTFVVSCRESSDNTWEDIVDIYENGMPKTVHYYPDRGNKDFYVIQKYYDDGSQSFEGTVENEFLVGNRFVFFRNGNAQEVVSILGKAELDDCCPDGHYTYYYQDGDVKQTYFKKDGGITGVHSVIIWCISFKNWKVLRLT